MQVSYFLEKIFFLNKVRNMVNLVLLVPIFGTTSTNFGTTSTKIDFLVLDAPDFF